MRGISGVGEVVFLLGDKCLEQRRVLLQEKDIEVEFEQSGLHFCQFSLLIKE